MHRFGRHVIRMNKPNKINAPKRIDRSCCLFSQKIHGNKILYGDLEDMCDICIIGIFVLFQMEIVGSQMNLNNNLDL